eukprot:6199197-Pleurochrysis_carterae.AAC.2
MAQRCLITRTRAATTSVGPIWRRSSSPLQKTASAPRFEAPLAALQRSSSERLGYTVSITLLSERARSPAAALQRCYSPATGRIASSQSGERAQATVYEML